MGWGWGWERQGVMHCRPAAGLEPPCNPFRTAGHVTGRGWRSQAGHAAGTGCESTHHVIPSVLHAWGRAGRAPPVSSIAWQPGAIRRLASSFPQGCPAGKTTGGCRGGGSAGDRGLCDARHALACSQVMSSTRQLSEYTAFMAAGSSRCLRRTQGQQGWRSSGRHRSRWCLPTAICPAQLHSKVWPRHDPASTRSSQPEGAVRKLHDHVHRGARGVAVLRGAV